jgi:hypothetical protein
MPQSSSVKRVKRLGGWHRIGITASILWLFFGAFWGSKAADIDRWRADCMIKLSNAIDPRPVTGGLSVGDWCIQQSDWRWPFLNYNTAPWYTALYSLLPIIFGWLTAYGIIVMVRWIRTGFKVPTSPN